MNSDRELPHIGAAYSTDAPPPSYESLFGKIKEAKDNSNGRVQFLKNVCGLIFATVGFIIILGILLSVPIAMIVIGGLNVSNCPLERFIPIWMITFGSVSIYLNIRSMVKSVPRKDEEEDEPESCSLFGGLNYLIGCFYSAWFIAGNVWVFRQYKPPEVSTDSLQYCDPTTYYFAFWLIIGSYIIAALIIFCCCCLFAFGKK